MKRTRITRIMVALGIAVSVVLFGPVGLLDEILDTCNGPKVKIGGAFDGAINYGEGPIWPSPGSPEIYGGDNPFPGPGSDPDNYDWTEHHREIEDETE